MRMVLQASPGLLDLATSQQVNETVSSSQDMDMVGVGAEDAYDVNLQVAGVFIIMAASVLGMGLSYAFGSDAQAPSNGLLYLSLQMLKGCGVGVIISTALIHLIGEAFEPFELSGFDELYPAWPMVFAMIGMFAMAILEYIHHRLEMRSRVLFASERAGEVEMAKSGGKTSKSSALEVTENPVADEPADLDKSGIVDQPISKSLAAKQRSAILVEASILIHSVLIGFDMGLQTKSVWIPLVIAISFHQFFEGFAVGQIVLDAQFTFWKKFAMTAFYSLTTSVGIVIGICTYTGEGYDGQSKGANITIGIIDSICGGLLLYTGMSVFWTEWFVVNPEMCLSDSLTPPTMGFLGVFLGMLIMSVIGIWA
mmetsp:Transcript_2496/g.9160  ORF Transcript_2496/g.9160 Transcript_2496/m.9160 type:complete len:367 (-) Transcript_2496:206-1306(-)